MCSYLDVSSNKLHATLPANLTVMSFFASDNQLFGTLPSTYGALWYLQDFVVCNNHLSGTIPSSFAKLRNLQE